MVVCRPKTIIFKRMHAGEGGRWGGQGGLLIIDAAVEGTLQEAGPKVFVNIHLRNSGQRLAHRVNTSFFFCGALSGHRVHNANSISYALVKLLPSSRAWQARRGGEGQARRGNARQREILGVVHERCSLLNPYPPTEN